MPRVVHRGFCRGLRNCGRRVRDSPATLVHPPWPWSRSPSTDLASKSLGLRAHPVPGCLCVAPCQGSGPGHLLEPSGRGGPLQPLSPSRPALIPVVVPFSSHPFAASDARPVQVREHTWRLEAELEKHVAAASAECQSYAQEVAGVSPVPGSPAGRAG